MQPAPAGRSLQSRIQGHVRTKRGSGTRAFSQRAPPPPPLASGSRNRGYDDRAYDNYLRGDDRDDYSRYNPHRDGYDSRRSRR